MTFQGAKDTAELWINSGKTSFSLLDADAEERKLIFMHETCSFYVVGPLQEKRNGCSWHVWSDQEDVLLHLSAIQDFLQKCGEKTLMEILTRVDCCLAPITQAGLEQMQVEENLDYEENIDDDYYDIHDDAQSVGSLPSDGEEAAAAPPGADVGVVQNGQPTPPAAVHRLLNDLKQLELSKGSLGFEAKPRDNILIWDVHLKHFEANSQLFRHLQQYALQYKCDPLIQLEMSFPNDYPYAPPFIRIIRPRFKFLTGHVTVGGSICMQMLTRSGWSSANNIESILIQVIAEIGSDQNVQLDPNNPDLPYDAREAQKAFSRTVEQYGWG